jgi:hypothetical protein
MSFTPQVRPTGVAKFWGSIIQTGWSPRGNSPRRSGHTELGNCRRAVFPGGCVVPSTVGLVASKSKGRRPRGTWYYPGDLLSKIEDDDDGEVIALCTKNHRSVIKKIG